MSGLPRGWVETSLAEISGGITYGFTTKSSTVGDGARLLRITDIQDYKVDWASLPFCDDQPDPAFLVRSGDIVVARTGATTGKSYLIKNVPVPTAFASYLIRIAVSHELQSDYVWKFMQGPDYWQQIQVVSKGTAQPGANAVILGQVGIPLPPLAEQKRIVAKLDALNAKSARARTELARIETLVSRYKQALLSKAFSGELTASYKVQRSNLSEPEEAPRHGRQEEPRKLKVRGATDIMKGIDLPPLPTGWNWVQNHSLAQNSANAICAGPFGTIFKAKDFREKGVPIIFLRHVGPGEYRTHKPGFMDEKVWRDLHQPYSVFGGELLVTKLGDPPGVACVYPTNAGTAMVTPDVIKMSVDESASHPAFLMHYFNSPTAKTIIKELAFGLTRLRVDLAMFKTFPIPLPPLEEQHEIVRRIESAFAKIDRLAKEAKRALELVGRLDEAILAKAFRGELVPQDENDEPAELLLARIRAEREAAPKGKRRLKNRA